MRVLSAVLFSLPLSLVALTHTHDAAACGGCLVQQQESTQVTGHKMILSIGKTQTTLWDQITYSGKPSSFAWVLPIKGTVAVGLSSDALFQTLDDRSSVVVSSPILPCSPPPFCDSFGATGTGGGAVGAPNDSPVIVLAQEVVGPYETVQLQSTDPNALKDWLSTHNYNLTAEIATVVEAYVQEGFNFLALKLVPGQEISAMRPVRVTTPGASPVLPLRMVAAGTGAVTPITLWVMGEGRYETTSQPTFTIDSSELIWNWDTQSSNYAELQRSTFASAENGVWQVESAEPIAETYITYSLDYLVETDPKASGYTEDKDKTLRQVYQDDMQALFGSIDSTSLWMTRFHSELPRNALAGDLQLGASSDQKMVDRYLTATQTVGTAPACPVFPPCENVDPNDSWGFWGVDEDSNHGTISRTSCAMTDHGSAPAIVSGFILGAALTLSRLRRRRR